MKLIRLIVFAAVIVISASVAGQAQTETVPQEQGPATSQAPVQIIRHKIGTDYYPMLDRPSLTSPSMAAEESEMPLPEAERIARQRSRTPSSSNKVATAPIAPGETRLRGRLRSYTRVIDLAEYVQVELKNSNSAAIKTVDWDFAFPRRENGQLLLRFDVTSSVEIKPGGKKTLKYKLPANAKKCEVVKVISDENQPDRVSTFEAVCGQGINDPSLLNQKQETITIKRIEFADGSVWRRQ
ncbi:MAG TPA: hypothetical protein PLK30_19245 [Blastocatellia bacterium]|nr:hypothetical protein [Blastocatellia bacterium]